MRCSHSNRNAHTKSTYSDADTDGKRNTDTHSDADSNRNADADTCDTRILV